MPAKSPHINQSVTDKIAALGAKIRARRKALGVNATDTAEAANMSRVTLYRIENGEPSVTLGAYMNVLAALGAGIEVIYSETPSKSLHQPGWIPARINLADYPQLRQLAWQVHGTDFITPGEALDIYERNWRHVEPDKLEPQEQQLIDALHLAFRKTTSNV